MLRVIFDSRLTACADTLLLDGTVENYEYLNKSRREVDGINDREEWGLLKVRGPESILLSIVIFTVFVIECVGHRGVHICRTTGSV